MRSTNNFSRKISAVVRTEIYCFLIFVEMSMKRTIQLSLHGGPHAQGSP